MLCRIANRWSPEFRGGSRPGAGGITVFPSGPCPQLVLRALDLRVLIGDQMWDPPGGTFDPNILSQPKTMTNVENGFGFIGAGYRVVAPLFPSREAVEYACFADAL